MKILIFGLNWIGDIVMTFPAINSISHEITVDVLTRPHLAELYSFNKRINKVLKVPTDSGISKLLPYLKKIRKMDYDKIIVLPNSLRTAIIAALCDSQSYGFKAEGRSILLSKSISKPNNFKSIHECELHRMLIEYAVTTQGFALDDSLNLQNSRTFMNLKNNYNLPTSKQFFCMAPGAAFGSAKRWPTSEFACLASKLIKKYNIPVILTGGPSEQSLATEITYLVKENIVNLTGKTSLKELIHLIGNAKLLVANDSGTMHLSTLTKTPVAIPVGPTDMIRTGPMHEESIIVKANTICPLAPCRKKVCPLKQHSCMENISADMLLIKIESLLKKII